MITLNCPSGIGDIYWLLMKLEKTGEKFHIRVPKGLMPVQTRSKFLEYLDCVELVTVDGMPYKELKIIASKYNYKKIENEMFIEANSWLEAGKRLENYLPKFEINYKLKWNISNKAKQKSKSYLKENKKNIVIYLSGLKNNNSRSTSPWIYQNWLGIIEPLTKMSDINLIWIGASYDYDLYKALKFQMTCVLDEPADVIINLLRNCDKFISYQSGLSCISVAESIPTYMLYFRKIDKLRFTFCPKDSINNPKLYTADFFDSVENLNVVEWVKND